MSDKSMIPPDGELVLAVRGGLNRADIPHLCERLDTLLREGRSPTGAVICDLRGLGPADAVAVEALARLQLTARRRGRRLQIRQGGADLQALIALMGLSEVLPVEKADGSGEVRRQAEERKEPCRIEEEGDAADAPVA